MGDIMTVGDRIKQRRLDLNLTMDYLAKAIKSSRQTIFKYEKNIITNIPSDRIEKLAKVLNCTPADLMGWDYKDENIIPITGGVPVVGRIVAGYPILAEENIEGYLPTMLKNPSEYLYLRVKGDSMKNAGIKSGALVLIHRQSCAENGDIVACRVNGDEATLKRFSQTKDIVILSPENSEYQPIVVPNRQFENGYAEIIGVVKQVTFDV